MSPSFPSLPSSILSLWTVFQVFFGQWLTAFFSWWRPDTLTKFSPTVVKLEYIYQGKRGSLYLPFSDLLASKLSGHQAQVVTDSSRLTITQLAGIPYFVRAIDFRASSLEISTPLDDYEFSGSEPVRI